MKLFQCQCCGQVLHFENTVCLRCGRKLGYAPEKDEMIAVEAEGPLWFAALPGDTAIGTVSGPDRWRFCRNWELSACNWMVHTGEEQHEYCLACRHNRTVPDLSSPENIEKWLKIEAAKRRLIYALIHLGLPMPIAGDGHAEPLVFDFLADAPDATERVLTGHADGVVTIALVEADDAIREKMREDMGENYRTLLGHFRHEVGHYYWDILVRDGGAIQSFRAMFGDESVDYAQALQDHYHNGAPPNWPQQFVSSYATMHPWEDWAETWAHYLHMIDTLETAAAFGMQIDPDIDDDGEMSADIDFDPYRMRSAQRLIAAWMPLSVALNALNRSMGQPDSYPFTLPGPVQDKLGFVHQLVSAMRIGGGAR
ncbi:MAG TPA: putative zinc-binding metallopeptidase [Paenirhodobacter sp.]